MLFGLGWPWWSARADRGELARANPAPAAVRRKLRREGAKRLAAESCLASDRACGGRAGFFRFIHCSLDWARRAPGPGGRLFSVWAGCQGSGGISREPRGAESQVHRKKVGPLYHFARKGVND